MEYVISRILLPTTSPSMKVGNAVQAATVVASPKSLGLPKRQENKSSRASKMRRRKEN